MHRLSKIVIFLLIMVDIILFLKIMLHGTTIAMFSPAGIIAIQERNFILFASLLGLSVVIPVIIAAYIMVWKYRSTNTSATYTPDWDTNKKLQLAWFGLLCTVLTIVGIMVWKSSHELDPYKPIQAKNQLTIQVVALRWKWLFIYPDQNIASVNYLRFPKDTALNFKITADAPMNAFWIPQLGGQVYAMTGMSSPFHLMATDIGTYRGSSTNISGDGFAGMRFTAESTTQADFDTWVMKIKDSPLVLNHMQYDILSKPSENMKPTFYTLGDKDLYNTIIMKYMKPKTENSPVHQTDMKSMHH